jgi:hypothetical protein
VTLAEPRVLKSKYQIPSRPNFYENCYTSSGGVKQPPKSKQPDGGKKLPSAY